MNFLVHIFFTIGLIVGLSSATLAQDQYTLPDGRIVAPLDVFRDCDVCPEMVVLPLGKFVMGAPLEESAEQYLLWNHEQPGVPPGRPEEGPQHEVIIDIPIAMGRNEVTREEWFACVNDGGCSHNASPKITSIDDARGYILADDPRSPVIDVSVLDAMEYVAWLNAKVGADVYRLPTEAEWEYAARAGTTTRFAQGEELTTDQANIAVFRPEPDRITEVIFAYEKPLPVDQLDAANAWGLRHMSGNVIEQTLSCWHDRHLALKSSSAYLDDAKKDESCKRVFKGGAYFASATYARPGNRGRGRENRRSEISGFRILREM